MKIIRPEDPPVMIQLTQEELRNLSLEIDKLWDHVHGIKEPVAPGDYWTDSFPVLDSLWNEI